MGAANVQRPFTCRGGHMRSLNRLLRLEQGQSLLEYGLLAALIALVALSAIGLVGEHLNRVFWTPIGPSI
jgi:Flp pilus assembly pilin Flp